MIESIVSWLNSNLGVKLVRLGEPVVGWVVVVVYVTVAALLGCLLWKWRQWMQETTGEIVSHQISLCNLLEDIRGSGGTGGGSIHSWLFSFLSPSCDTATWVNVVWRTMHHHAQCWMGLYAICCNLPMLHWVFSRAICCRHHNRLLKMMMNPIAWGNDYNYNKDI